MWRVVYINPDSISVCNMVCNRSCFAIAYVFTSKIDFKGLKMCRQKHACIIQFSSAGGTFNSIKSQSTFKWFLADISYSSVQSKIGMNPYERRCNWIRIHVNKSTLTPIILDILYIRQKRNEVDPDLWLIWIHVNTP